MDRIKVKVSLIISAYNGARTIARCLNSCLNQDLYEHIELEVIAVNDCSSDETPVILSQYGNEEVSVLHHSTNRGLAAARNTGLREASGHILFFLDSDMIAEPGFVKSHLQYYEQDSALCGVVNGNIPGPTVPRNKFTKYLYRQNRGASSVGEGGRLPPHFILFNCTSIRRNVYEVVGGFDETIRLYGGEDTEYAYRIHRHTNCRFIYTEQTVLEHDHYRRFEETRNLLYRYGQETLPSLVRKYPELAKAVGVKFMGIAQTSSFSIKQRLFLSSLAEKVMKFLFYALPSPLANLPIKYLLGVSLLRGYYHRF